MSCDPLRLFGHVYSLPASVSMALVMTREELCYEKTSQTKVMYIAHYGELPLHFFLLILNNQLMICAV